MKQWLIEMWDNLLWHCCLVRRSQALHTQSEMRAALDRVDTLQRQIAAFHEEHREERADRLTRALNAKRRNSERARKGWVTRRAA